MDGGGRLDQPLMRSRPIAAEAIGAPVDEPSSPRAENRLHRNLINRVTALADYRHSFRRSGARIVRSLSPSSSAMAVATVLLAAAVGYSVVAGGHLANVGTWAKTARDQVANAVGLRIAAISVSGSKEVSREEILTTAGVSGRGSLLFLDAAAARARLLSNPWIADAAVLKLYPDRLQISVTERQAFALWQKNGRVSVIAPDGTVLEPYIEDRYLDLPLVVGPGAEIHANDFFAILGRFAAIRTQLRASVLVAERDVGSSKIACVIARLRPHAPQQVLTRRTHAVEVIGLGHAAARGTKAGGVVNLAQAEQAIRRAVDGAERVAGVEIESVVLSISAGRLASELFAAEIDMAGSAVSENEIARVLAAGNRHAMQEGRVLLHSLPIGYSIDGGNGLRDPRGKLGARFGVDMHVAMPDIAAARNLMLAVERCHLNVEAMVAGPYVAGLAVLADDEADLGAAVVDMGAGTTTIAVFLGGRFMHSEGFALGGINVTRDVARGLNAAMADAERIKTLYGSVLLGGSDESDMISVPTIGEDERDQAQFVPRSALIEIIRPRVEEILEMVRDRLNASSFA